MIGNCLKKRLSVLNLAWKFKSFDPKELKSVYSPFGAQFEEIKPSFIKSYRFILDSLASSDLKALKTVCKREIYSSLETMISDLQSKNQKLKIVNPDDEIQVEFFDEEFIFSDSTNLNIDYLLKCISQCLLSDKIQLMQSRVKHKSINVK